LFESWGVQEILLTRGKKKDKEKIVPNRTVQNRLTRGDGGGDGK